MNAKQRRQRNRLEQRIERKIRLDIGNDARADALHAAQDELERSPTRLLSKSRNALRRIGFGQRLGMALGVLFP